MAPSQKYLLCLMPAEWENLTVHRNVMFPPKGSIGVYRKHKKQEKLVCQGYICPTDPEKMHMSALQPPLVLPRRHRLGYKYAKLTERIRVEEGADILSKILKSQRNRVDSASSSKPVEDDIPAESTTTITASAIVPESGDIPIETNLQPYPDVDIAQAVCAGPSGSVNKPDHLNMSVQRSVNMDYPPSSDIQDRREHIPPAHDEGWTKDFIRCMETWTNAEDMDVFDFETFDYSGQ
ncbi:uncharacterized protein LOC125021386 [Mugil cephalus]|uniref:uncharacterized protein LOC125021386 n=1 Tax=Mugil cephalus TaxID=48193 RepID=UPI001FB58B6F|nr:uncharacterized protein LOC125021386 [Mugil cephalus]